VNATLNVSCSLGATYVSNGSVVEWNGPTVSTNTPSGIQTLNLGTAPATLTNASYYIYCTIPRVTSGSWSGVIGYDVTETLTE
jgi:hypothetical protein